MSEEQKNVTAIVKWFKNDKGFGFVRLADGSGEVFLHSRVVAPLGEVPLTEGTVLVCDVADTAKGPQVSAIHSVTPPAAPAEPKAPRAPKPRRARGAERPPAKPGEFPAARTDAPQAPLPAGGETVYGTVRWYNLTSQSGLIDPWDDDSGVGIYFDRAVLRRSGLDIVADGEDVRFVAVPSEDGPVALKVELA